MSEDFKLEFSNKKHLEILEVLDLVCLLNAENSLESFLNSDNISLLYDDPVKLTKP